MNSYINILLNNWWINILLAMIIIFFDRRDPKSTLIWVMSLIFLPYLGFILYLFLGGDYRKFKKFKLKAEEDRYIREASSLQSKKINEDLSFFENKESQKYKSLIELSLALDEAFYTENNDIKFFYFGKDKFKSFIEDIKNAKKSIDLEYYIFKHDNIGKYIIKILEKKAKEGVKVRILYDAVGSRRLHRYHFKELLKNGGKVCSFFPSFLKVVNFRLNYRNHRKLAIIDDKIGYIGGINIGDEYLGLSKKFGVWRDTHARIEGESVLGMKLRFLKDWHYASKEEVEGLESFDFNMSYKGYIGIQIITAGPDTKYDNIKNIMFNMITGAKKEIF